ncbi:MAG: hypothetical protein IJX29_03750 [Bacteroides sp.]|nr:hypothetical protein [Bacteroides sp.]
MEYLIIALITIYCPWLVPLLFVIGVFVWLYFSCEPAFWVIIIALVVVCIASVIYSGKKY